MVYNIITGILSKLKFILNYLILLKLTIKHGIIASQTIRRILATSKHFDSNCIFLTTFPIFDVQMPQCVLRKGHPLTTQVHHKAFLWHYIIQQTYKWNVKIMLNDEDTCNEI